MFRYSAFALTIESELELPGLAPGQGPPDVVIRLGRIAISEQEVMTQRVTLNDEVLLNDHAGTFHLKQGSEIVLDMLPERDPAALRMVLLGRVMAFLLRQRGWLPLHASGVTVGGRTVLFLGASGAGKSTTAAVFHAAGHPAITDDVGAVRVVDDHCLVCPAGTRLRLLAESVPLLNPAPTDGIFEWDKYTFNLAGSTPLVPLNVSRIYILGYGNEIHSESLSQSAAVALLSRYSFTRRRRMDRDSLSAHLRNCALVTGSVPVCRLVRPHSLESLPALVRWVEGDLSCL